MKILIIGAGMYVTGRKNTGVGTILASLVQLSKEIAITELCIAATNNANKEIVETKTAELNRKLKANLFVRYQQISRNAHNDIIALNSTNFDCAIISVPDNLHFTFAKLLLERKIPVLVVKPLVENIADNLKLIDIQKNTNTYGAVEYHKRFDESNLYNKKMLQENAIGQILYFTIDYSQRISVPLEIFSGWAAQTNIFQYLGVHYVDMIYFLTAAIPVKVYATGIYGILKNSGINTYDSIHVQIEWISLNDNHKFISIFNTNWIDSRNSSAMSDQKYKIIGTEGRIESDQKNRGIEVVNKQGISNPNPYFSDFLPNENGDMIFQGYGYKRIRQFIVDTVELKNDNVSLEFLEKNRAGFKQSLIISAVIEAVNKSLKTGNFVTINQTLVTNIFEDD